VIRDNPAREKMGESTLPQSLSGPAVDPDHPWLGLHPFAEENHRYFFGRTAEVRDIFLRVRENPLTVLYGQSGLGKTSLLRAGLIPKLCVERHPLSFPSTRYWSATTVSSFSPALSSTAGSTNIASIFS